MGSLESWVSTTDLITILIVIASAIVTRFLLVRLVRGLTNRALAKAKARREHPESRAERILATVTLANDERYQQRTATMGTVITSLISVAIWVVAILTVLAILGVPLTPLLTSAGVGGIALAFGAQSLVKDFLSGMFMIMEDQYGVGDLIDTGDVKGTVEDVGLRLTRLRDATGTVWYVRNGEIQRVGNLSQGWSTAIVDVPVAYDEDPGRVIAVLEGVAKDMDADPAFADVLLDTPVVAGVNSVTATAMSIRITAKTAPNQQWGIQRALLERALQALGRAGIRSPAVNLGVLPD